MKVVKNTSMQGIYVAFETPEGPTQRFVASKASIRVPDSWGGRAPDNMVRRRMLKITHVDDAPVPTPTPKTQPSKKLNKKSN